MIATENTKEDDALRKYEFKKKIEELREMKGRATELISLYIPPHRRISDVMAYMRNEYAQSSNIKSKSTRKNVMSAIESIMNRLRHYKKPPKNGIAFFVGHRAIGADQTELIVRIIEPIEPITTFLYRCDSSFYTEPLEEMLVEKERYGLIVMDRREATIGIVKGKRIESITNFESLVPSKHGKGGQSQRRFERLIEEAAHEFFKKVGRIANETFLGDEKIRGIIIGGPGPTKDYFVDKDYLHYDLKKKILAVVDTGYTDESGLRELVMKAEEVLRDIEIMREKNVMQRFLAEITKRDGGLAAYGENDVRQALQMGAVEILLISEDLKKKRIEIECTNKSCEYNEVKTITDSYKLGTCPKCNASLIISSKIDMVNEFYELAKAGNAKVEIISTETDEGSMLSRAFGAIAAILRYKW